jgi:hypothetical protein
MNVVFSIDCFGAIPMHVSFSIDYFGAIPMDVPFAMQSNCIILNLVLTKKNIKI